MDYTPGARFCSIAASSINPGRVVDDGDHRDYWQSLRGITAGPAQSSWLPYAIPPVPPRRFMAPCPTAPWAGARSPKFCASGPATVVSVPNSALVNNPAFDATRNFRRGIEGTPTSCGEGSLALDIWSPSSMGRQPVTMAGWQRLRARLWQLGPVDGEGSRRRPGRARSGLRIRVAMAEPGSGRAAVATDAPFSSFCYGNVRALHKVALEEDEQRRDRDGRYCRGSSSGGTPPALAERSAGRCGTLSHH